MEDFVGDIILWLAKAVGFLFLMVAGPFFVIWGLIVGVKWVFVHCWPYLLGGGLAVVAALLLVAGTKAWFDATEATRTKKRSMRQLDDLFKQAGLRMEDIARLHANPSQPVVLVNRPAK